MEFVLLLLSAHVKKFIGLLYARNVIHMFEEKVNTLQLFAYFKNYMHIFLNSQYIVHTFAQLGILLVYFCIICLTLGLFKITFYQFSYNLILLAIYFFLHYAAHC